MLVESNAPVPGVQVAALYAEDGARPLPEVVAVTDASGSYALRVPTRTDATALPHMRVILISFVAPPRHVVIGGPPAAIVGADSDSTGVDVLLAPVFLVTGRVLRTGGTAAQSGRVKAVQPDDTTVFGFGHGTDSFAPQASADATGRYELAVARGVYALSADGDGGRGWWSDEPAIFQASLLVVDRDRTGIDVVLVPTLSFLGVQVRSGQVPIDSVGVTAYGGGDARCCTLVGRATTRATAKGGNSGLAALWLPEGTYRIRVEPPTTTSLRPQWWNGALDFAAATDITVMASSGARIEVDLGSSP